MDGVLISAARRAVFTFAALLAMNGGQAHAEGDAAHGATIFQVKCASCHHTQKGAAALIGPNLFGVAGRKAGTAPGFPYSSAMKNTGYTWTDTQLITYLKAPMNVVPGTKMTFIGLKRPGEAEDVAAYLKTLK